MKASVDQAAARALEAGVRFFQYRNKRGTRRAIYETSLRLAGLLRRAGALFIVNDHADIAMAVDADGVHLGQEDLPIASARKLLGAEKLIGISTHSQEQARAAQAGGADYIGFGPIFNTGTKDAGPSRGTGDLRLVRDAVTIPIIAIGGITKERVEQAIQAGADGVAVISAILAAPDMQQEAREMVRLVERTRHQSNR